MQMLTGNIVLVTGAVGFIGGHFATYPGQS
jgi:nucleoside-diphosphate-sugar epimerase